MVLFVRIERSTRATMNNAFVAYKHSVGIVMTFLFVDHQMETIVRRTVFQKETRVRECEQIKDTGQSNLDGL